MLNPRVGTDRDGRWPAAHAIKASNDLIDILDNGERKRELLSNPIQITLGATMERDDRHLFLGRAPVHGAEPPQLRETWCRPGLPEGEHVTTAGETVKCCLLAIDVLERCIEGAAVRRGAQAKWDEPRRRRHLQTAIEGRGKLARLERTFVLQVELAARVDQEHCRSRRRRKCFCPSALIVFGDVQIRGERFINAPQLHLHLAAPRLEGSSGEHHNDGNGRAPPLQVFQRLAERCERRAVVPVGEVYERVVSQGRRVRYGVTLQADVSGQSVLEDSIRGDVGMPDGHHDWFPPGRREVTVCSAGT